MLIRFAVIGAWMLACGSIIILTGAGQQTAAQKGVRLDHYGDPLPEHALTRIGTTRWRPNVEGRGYLTAMAFTKDGKRLVTLNQFSGAQVWEAATGRKLLAFGKPAIFGGEVYAVSPDGSRAAVIESEKVCRIFDTAIGKQIGTVDGNWYSVGELRFSPNNKYLGVFHNTEKCVAVWDVARGKKLWQVPVAKNSSYGRFAFTDDEKIAVFSPSPGAKEEGSLVLSHYDAATGKKFERESPIITDGARTIACSPDGKLIAAFLGSNEFTLWNLTSGKLLHEPKTHDDSVSRLCFSPDGKWIVTGSNHGRVRLWDVATGVLERKLAADIGAIYSLAFSPDSKRIAAAGSDGALRIWDAATGNDAFPFEGHRMRNVQARFSSDGKTILSFCGFNSNPSRSADERTFRFWDSTTGKALRQVELERKEFLPLCLSDDGRFFFVIDKGVSKQDLVTGKADKVFGVPADYYRYCCSANGKYLAALTDDHIDERKREMKSNYIRVADTASQKEILALDGKKGEHFVCNFTEDGRYLAVNTFRYELRESAPRPSSELTESYLTLWDIKTGRKVLRPNLLPKKWDTHAWPFGDKVSPNVRLALTGSHDNIELRELATNTKLAEISTGWLYPENGAFSRNSNFFAMGNDKGQIMLWSVFPPRRLVTLSGHSATVKFIRFSPDGKSLVSGSDDTTILTWNIAPWTTPAAKPLPPVANELKLWQSMADPNAAKAFAAMGELVQSPKDAVKLFNQQLRPVSLADAKKTAALIAELDSDRFVTREKATAELQDLGYLASVALEKAVEEKQTLEKRQRIEQLLKRLQTQPMRGDSLRITRTLQVLEAIGSAEAAKFLEALASGEPDSWLTQEAGLSLTRVRSRTN